MKALILVILLITCTNSYDHACVITVDDVHELKESLDEFDYDDFMERLGTLSTNEFYNNALCHVELFVDYTKQIFTVKFTDHHHEPSDNELLDQEIQVDTKFVPATDDIEDPGIASYLAYAYAKNGCEIKFIAAHIHRELEMHIVPLLIDDYKEPGK